MTAPAPDKKCGTASAADPGLTEPGTFHEQMARVVLQEVEVAGKLLRPGSRVRLQPGPGGDLMSSILAGRTAVVESMEQDDAGALHVAVTVEDDPGRALSGSRHPAHRFFFAPGELEPLEDTGASSGRRVLVAGIGNVFLGDDGFGVAVVQRLLERGVPPGVEVVDFGIRGRDLAYALGQPYDAVILVDTIAQGDRPGTLVILDAQQEDAEAPLPDGHRMDPVAVLALARQLGPLPERILVVGCVPDQMESEWIHAESFSLSAPVAAALEPATDLVQQLAAHLLTGAGEATSP